MIVWIVLVSLFIGLDIGIITLGDSKIGKVLALIFMVAGIPTIIFMSISN